MTLTRESQTSSAPSRQSAQSAQSAQSGSRDRTALRQMSYAEQVQALSPSSGAADVEFQGTDIPGNLYSNTSRTNLNKESDWPARLSFALATEYEAQVTFADLVLAGRAVRAPQGNAVGPVKVPAGAPTRDTREYDFIDTPAGRVEETGNTSFLLRGGADANDPVTLRFANNGALNLARLARAAYELAVDKGVTFTGNRINWNGKTFALSCTVQMGNEVDAEGARAYGYVGEFDLAWIQEKVSETVQRLAAATSVACGRGQVGGGADAQSGAWVHPNHESVGHLQTNAWEAVETASGGTAYGRTQQTSAINSSRFSRSPVVRAWGEGGGSNQRAWIRDPDTLAARVQHSLAFAWAPGSDWRGHPTYITESPDFTDVILACFQASQGADKKQMAGHIATAMRAIAARLAAAPMDHQLLGDPEQESRLERANKAIIAGCFSRVTASGIKGEIEKLSGEQRPPVTRGSEKPVEGDAPNGEGLVLLRDWSSRGG
jgi:hypothetical protein